MNIAKQEQDGWVRIRGQRERDLIAKYEAGSPIQRRRMLLALHAIATGAISPADAERAAAGGRSATIALLDALPASVATSLDREFRTLARQ